MILIKPIEQKKRFQIQVYAKRELHKVRGLYHSPAKTLFKPSRLHTIDRFLI